MLKVQLSIPDLKAQVQSIREMALDPVATLQSLVSDLRPGFEEWMNDLMKAELSLHPSREPRHAPSRWLAATDSSGTVFTKLPFSLAETLERSRC